MRRKTCVIKVGNINIGGKNPIAIQGMIKTPTKKKAAALKEIKSLFSLGADIVRLAVKDAEDAQAIKFIKKSIKSALVADIHFDYRLALACIKNGIDKIRLNPGNIFQEAQVRQIVELAKKTKVPIRIGVNSGSLRESKTIKEKAAFMVKSAAQYIKLLEKNNFKDIVVSLKAEDVNTTIEAYRKLSDLCDYPMHLGVTATGSMVSAVVKSSIGIGVLLKQGIGDTIRVSLTSSSCDEIDVAKKILSSLDIRHFGPEVISCPTCGRCSVNLKSIVEDLEASLARKKGRFLKPGMKIAVMGCEVNGPGEARSADLGVAFGNNNAILFKESKLIKRVKKDNVLRILTKELEKYYET
ncbi:MAG: flavodoxin-dependent (E)-4-hydroxy-3-methylbut-2-enyl-diphosphate synthase [Candidatus Gygaella obscura]|nr:flavodoxin-dependent (E)-4-hydroxy-3-methylbut-2-enyl-diphosphate synthase [Candidatus Gygaella obscura]